MLDALAGSPGTDPGAEIHRIRALYDGILRERYDRPEPRLADLDQLQHIAAGYPSRAAFLSELALEPPSSTQDLAGPEAGEDDLLVLSTAHSAKGREWDVVFVIWAVDGWFPSSRALRSDDECEEERRLMYVALTRARDHLYAVYPLNVYGSRYGADYSIDQLSRFFDVGVRERMRRTAAYPAAPASGTDSSGDLQRVVDLRALLRGRFGA
jgi:DNA helicase-2/ATP-dependent DNA helicase PcrA